MHRREMVVIGGAGPHAGVLLLQQVIDISQKEYGAWRDQDFPYIVYINFPFADMLEDSNNKRVSEQMKELASEVSPDRCSYWAIACNTLHGFLDGMPLDDRFIHIMKPLKEESKGKRPLVLCTTTSRKKELHKKFIDCIYPSDAIQNQVDVMIDHILHGRVEESFSRQIEKWAEQYPDSPIILGCTEISFLNSKFPIHGKILDPSLLLAQKLCQLHFLHKNT